VVTGPVTVMTRGRPLVIAPAALEAELAGDGPVHSLELLEAVVRSPAHGGDRARAVARLRRAVAAGDVGVQTMQAVMGLVRLEAKEGAPELHALAGRLSGPPADIARAAAYLVEDRAADLADALLEDPALARHSPQPYMHLPRTPDGAPRLFIAWMAELGQNTASLGSTAFRAFLGDVSEAAFRSLQHGADPNVLLGEAGRNYLVDAICAELGGTTDFLAARGMAWLLGALAPTDDDTARAALERCATRFRDPEFQADITAILTGAPWPPR
jgi:hypothetical protein